MNSSDYKLVENPLGFLSVDPLPDAATLNAFYKEKYFQTQTSCSYQGKYSCGELNYFRAEVESSVHILSTLGSLPESPTLLDVGCGEGFFSAHCQNLGWQVWLCDYSRFGLEQHNPQLLDYFSQGDIQRNLEDLIVQGRKFSLINLKNVLEHVIDPKSLLDKVLALMDRHGMIRIEVPNDYSPFQDLLQQHNKTGNTWFCPPEHLHYFNKERLQTFVSACGLRLAHMTGDFPIEMYLANDYSNYSVDRSRGKQAHLSRVMINNYVFSQGVDKYVEFISCMATVGLSRNLTVYICK